MNKNNYLTLGGLFVALHLLFIMMAKFLPGSELILVIFLPLLSTIYALKFDYKALVLFLVATFFLTVIFEPVSTFIYVVPGLICGSLYGILAKNKVKELSLVYLSSLGHSLSLLIAFLAISLLFKEVNFFDIFSKFIHKEGTTFYVCIYLVLILIGLLEAFLVHFITNAELKRMGYKDIDKEEITPLWMNVCLIFSLISYFILAIINPIFSCYALPFVVAFCVPNVIEFISFNKRRWIYFLMLGLLFLSIFLLKEIDKIFYPMLLVLIISPILLEKFVRILYTIFSKCLNNGKNKIE